MTNTDLVNLSSNQFERLNPRTREERLKKINRGPCDKISNVKHTCIGILGEKRMRVGQEKKKKDLNI